MRISSSVLDCGANSKTEHKYGTNDPYRIYLLVHLAIWSKGRMRITLISRAPGYGILQYGGMQILRK